MKKQSFYRDLLRTIYKSKARFLSIMAIIAIGVGFYAGINATEPDMILSADKYYKQNNLSDFRIYSPLGFKEKDILDVKAAEGIGAVQEGYTKDLFLSSNEGNTSIVKVFSYNDKYGKDGGGMNIPEVLDGRMPEKSGEIVVEHGASVPAEIKIGSKVVLSVADEEELGKFLKTDTFVVVGIIESPLYIDFERGQTNIGDGSIDFIAYLRDEDFAMENKTDIFVTTRESDKLSVYSKEYDEHLAPIETALEKLGSGAMALKIKEAMDELADGRKELEENRAKADKELTDAENELLDAEKEIAANEKELNENERKFTRELEDQRALLRKGKEDLEKGKAVYDGNYKKWLAGYEEYQKGARALDIARIKLEEAAGQMAQMEAVPPELKEQYDKELAVYETELKKLNAAKPSIDGGKLELDRAKAEIDKNEITIREGGKALDKASQDLEARLKDGREQLEKGRKELSDGWKTYEEKEADALKKIKDAENDLIDAEKLIAKIPDQWFIFSRDDNPGYSGYGDDTRRIGAVARVFPLFFFLVAALVCLTTMTRMIEEERGEIGTLKALGYGTLTISSKYLVYALLSSLLGALLGLSVGFKLFPNAIMNAYGIMYYIPVRLTPYHPDYALVSVLLAVVTTVSAALLAARQELRAAPAVLIQPRAPKPGKRIFIERITPLWSRLSFLHKVTARNIFRYKRRFLMTVIGIAGCTALLLTGFGLKDSINDIMDKQFDEIFIYDGQVMTDTEKKPDERDMKNILGKNSKIESYLEILDESGKAVTKKSGRSHEVNLFVPNDTKAFVKFIKLHERVSRKEIELANDGAVITEKLSELLNVKIGDTLEYSGKNNKSYEIRITAIAENYFSHYIFMSPEYHNKITMEQPGYNGGVFNLTRPDVTDEDAFMEELMSEDGVLGAMMTGSIADKVRDTMESLDYVVLILIISAGALAFVVLYNLTNINITERIREIATIKVLGFRDNEVSSYVYRENMILAVIGTLAGLVLGFWLHRFVIHTMEIDTMMFGQNVHPKSYLLSILLTLVFSILVNFFMHYRLKNVNMVESLKSIE